MRLNKYIYLLITTLFLSCTDRNPDDESLKNYTNRISNKSNFSFSFIIENVSNDIILNKEIKPNDHLDFCKYSTIDYNGIACPNFKTIKIKFPNSMGYICSFSENNLCIPTKNFIEDNVDTHIGDNIYEIVIDNEDYEKAFEL